MVNDLSSLLAITYVDYIESHCITGDFILNKHRVNEAFVITCSWRALYNGFNAIYNIDANA